MWVGGVEIPAELVDAHRRGRLVLFVGAGASRDAPSDLPDFRRLTEWITQQAQYDATDAELDQPDVVLGRVKDGDVDVHLLVAQHLSNPDSRHNKLHQAIVDLAVAGPKVRIVTTNFDRHLTSAIEARGAETDEYAAPALPMGNDFTGVVYLHGTLRQPPHRLVLTIDDFGTAYIRDAWAARFLERMFAEYSVLFVGYSHGDVVMRYLARALGADGHRYVLTDTPDARDWKYLRLRPIGYEVVSGSHAALGIALGRWAERAAMGLLDHRQQVAELVQSVPSGIPEDESYLQDVIADPDLVGLFTEFARDIEWLDWASNQEVFNGLFIRGARPRPTHRALAAWFVDSFVLKEECTDRALAVVRERGGHLGPDVWDCVGRHMSPQKSPRPPWLGPWLVLMLRDVPLLPTQWLDYALRASKWPQDKEQLVLLFDYLTEPVPTLDHAMGLGPTRVDVFLRGDEYWLSEAWNELLKPNVAEVAHALVAIADRHLRRVRDLQAASRSDGSDWDATSFGRSAIEPHSQDHYREPIDVLIDAARDGIESLIDASDPIAAGYLHAWAGAESRLLNRLAIHGWTHRADVDDSAKIEWVVRSGWLTDHHVRHEAFRLVASAIPGASDDAVGVIVGAIMHKDEGEPDYRPYERFNALVWLNRHRAGHPVIEAALAQAHAVDPTWQEREDPDLTHSISGGGVPSRPPMTIGEFHERLLVDPFAAISTLQENKDVRPWDERPTWEDSLSLIISAVQADPNDGYLILDADPTDRDVTHAVIEGWSRSDLSVEIANDVLARLRELDRSVVVGELARMLSDGGRLEGHPTDWAALPEARALARELWDQLPAEPVEFPGVDWLTRAINHPAGNLAQFWLRALQDDWVADEAGWSGLTVEHREALEAMSLGGSSEVKVQMAEVICTSRLHFLFAADEQWTAVHGLPLLDWSDPSRAARTWSSFLFGGRWNDQMLDAGLMHHYLAGVDHLSELDDDHRQTFLGHLAGIALTSDRDPLDWLPRVIVVLSEEQRVTFADRVAAILDDLPAEAVEHQWHKWISPYWNKRLVSIPVQLSVDEAAAMAGWIPFLTESFEMGAERVLKRPGRFREHDDVLRHLAKRADDSPRVCAQVIGHLMRGTQPPWWGGHHHLSKVMSRLKAGGDPEDLRVISEEAMRLGLPHPDDW